MTRCPHVSLLVPGSPCGTFCLTAPHQAWGLSHLSKVWLSLNERNGLLKSASYLWNIRADSVPPGCRPPGQAPTCSLRIFLNFPLSLPVPDVTRLAASSTLPWATSICFRFTTPSGLDDLLKCASYLCFIQAETVPPGCRPPTPGIFVRSSPPSPAVPLCWSCRTIASYHDSHLASRLHDHYEDLTTQRRCAQVDVVRLHTGSACYPWLLQAKSAPPGYHSRLPLLQVSPVSSPFYRRSDSPHGSGNRAGPAC